MRIGFNPNKDKLLSKSHFFHQVIVPVYIPNHEDYFKDSFEIFRIHLESLFKTCHSRTYITVINNGSSTSVANYLDDLLKDGKLNEVIHTTSIGKLNAILKGLAGHHFPLVTVSDADVLFVEKWQENTYLVFEAFPKAGVVSPVPNSKNLRYYTANVIWDTFFRKISGFKKVKDPKAMMAFAESIGNPNLFKKVHLEKVLTVRNDKTTAIIGAGHFVATYRSECFNNYKYRFSKYSLGGDSEQLILDKPASQLGLWRLSTEGNYAFHMGNVKEEWMYEKLQTVNKNCSSVEDIALKGIKYSRIWDEFINVFFARIIFRNPFWKLYLRLKGLNKEEIKHY